MSANIKKNIGEDAAGDLLHIISGRRSIRKYKNASVQDVMVKKILEAGRWAPSGLNNQPWRFLVVKDSRIKEKLSSFTKYANIIKNAPVVIVILMDTADSYNRQKDLMAMGACIENMLLETHSLGLGACWLGEILNKSNEVSGFLNLDRDLELMAVIAIGHPTQKPKSCRKPLKSLLLT